MAPATGSMIQISILQTPNYESSPKNVNRVCAYRGKQPIDRVKAGGGSGAQKNSLGYATNSLSLNSDQNDQNTSPRSICNMDYDYEI
ncbi:unnamed protein product [Trifolium pratense]|uniref:Uncharacterized protein n=1 Tax=Trifolium pratense TaxID=57577 RepID=A0ACB0KQV2_TRIPR|nr:unnamed protein product [Trifolium pratense]